MSLATEYRALRQAAGIVDRSTRGRIRVTGADRRTYLQGLLSNDIVALTPGSGCYATYLTPQGRMIADMRVFETGRSLLVELDATLADSIAERWDQFVFSEDVQISNESTSTAEIGIYGPTAAAVIASAFASQSVSDAGATEETFRALSVNSVQTSKWRDVAVEVIAGDDIGVHGFDLVVPVASRDEMVEALERAGGTTVGSAAVELCRVEGGRPLFGVDMNEETIPLEAGIEDRAISLTKGCYVGQEVIIRVLHRGHGRVARRLVGITFEPGVEPPSPGDKIVGDDREIGRITSAVQSLALGRAIALGYVHRDFVQPGATVTIEGNNGTVTQLPFVPFESSVTTNH